MAETLEGYGGGIAGLYGLLTEHREAIDYDCLTLGLDVNQLGTQEFDWCRFRAVVTYLPSSSALARSVHGEKVEWTVTEHLLAAAVDALSAANWQRGGGKGKKPRPLPRPGVEDDTRKSKRMGTGRMSLDDAAAFFDRINRAPAGSSCSDDGCSRPVKARQMCGKHYQRWWRANR